MKRPHILLDVDGVLADFVGGVLRTLHGAGLATHLDTYSFRSLDLPRWMDEHEAAHYEKHCPVPGFCGGLEWYPGARLFLSALQTIGTVQIVTRPWVNSTWCEERTAWLGKHFDGEVLFTADKSRVRGDVLIEDDNAHLDAWGTANPGHPILIDRPWNKGGRHWRTYTYAETIQLVKDLTK